jgi:hypothetical protein
MIVITVVAILLGLAVTFTGFLTLIFFFAVWCVLPTPLVVCAIFGRGDVRAFSVGGLVPWVLMLRDSLPDPALWIWLPIVAVVCGIVAVFTYRWVQGRR